MLDWRNTPSEQLHQSLAQIMFGRQTRTRLPVNKQIVIDAPRDRRAGRTQDCQSPSGILLQRRSPRVPTVNCWTNHANEIQRFYGLAKSGNREGSSAPIIWAAIRRRYTPMSHVQACTILPWAAYHNPRPDWSCNRAWNDTKHCYGKHTNHGTGCKATASDSFRSSNKISEKIFFFGRDNRL